MFACCNTTEAQEKNSMRKIRVKPSQQASKIGSAVNWETSFADALAKSKETGKPVFWYVPTLRGSFMDRKIEIDRYMLAGPFSWPNLIKAINDNFVPVRAMPTRDEQKQFELLPYKFVEPGFLIIQSDSAVTARVDHITTFSPNWFRKLLSENGVNVPRPKTFENMQAWWASFRAGNYDVEIPVPNDGVHHATEQMLLAGMFKFRQGKHEEARELWKTASQIRPNTPLAWKAAAEAEGFGPFSRGFEVFRSVPVEAMTAGINSVGSASPKGVYDEAAIWNRSIQFLLGMQRQDGGWVDSDYDFGGTDSLPNVHVAVTALCGMSLLEARSRLPELKDKIDLAITNAAKFVNDPKNLNLVDRDEILWAHAYKLRFTARLIADGLATPDQLNASVVDLQNVQSNKGHWYHEYNNSWVTATALCALREAQLAGATIDLAIVERGCSALANDRMENGAYGYYPQRRTGKKPAGTDKSIEAAAGRMPTCDLGLFYWDKLSNEQLAGALKFSFKHHDQLAVALKYDNHTNTHEYGGFFFWYDMRARSEAISQVKDETLRAEFFAQQKELILNLPEFDGCFVDSHELGRCYGTAMALLCLGRED
jgi:hypothetical protein